MLFSKKASLDLSINAIVILILAITMLGLGLGFIKNTFSKTTEQFEEVGSDFKNQLIDAIKESNERLVFNKYDIEVKKGASKEFYIGINNDLNMVYDFSLLDFSGENSARVYRLGGPNDDVAGQWVSGGSTIECYDNIIAETGEEESILAYSQTAVNFETFTERNIGSNDISVIKVIIDVPSTSKATTYSCGMVIACPEGSDDECTAATGYARKDFYVTVT